MNAKTVTGATSAIIVVILATWRKIAKNNQEAIKDILGGKDLMVDVLVVVTQIEETKVDVLMTDVTTTVDQIDVNLKEENATLKETVVDVPIDVTETLELTDTTTTETTETTGTTGTTEIIDAIILDPIDVTLIVGITSEMRNVKTQIQDVDIPAEEEMNVKKIPETERVLRIPDKIQETRKNQWIVAQIEIEAWTRDLKVENLVEMK
jgi:hypothetical protein